MFKIVVAGTIVGLVVGLACFFAFKLAGSDFNPAVVGAVAGGIGGAIVPTLLARKSK